MKNLLLPALFVSVLFVSCTTDENENIVKTNAASNAGVINSNIYSKAYPEASNQNNPYDAAGRLFIDINNAVIAASPTHTVSAICTSVDQQAGQNTDFTALGQNYGTTSTTTVQWVLNKTNNSTTIINATNASAAGRQKLAELLTMAESYNDKLFTECYNNMLVFEQGIVNNAALTDADKNLILMVASVARYGAYDGGKDGKWYVRRHYLHGAITGANTGIQQAITISVACSRAE